MYIWINPYTYIYTYTYAHEHLHMYICMCTHPHGYMYVCMHVYTHIYEYTCLWICTYIVCKFIYISGYINIIVHVDIVCKNYNLIDMCIWRILNNIIFLFVLSNHLYFSKYSFLYLRNLNTQKQTYFDVKSGVDKGGPPLYVPGVISGRGYAWLLFTIYICIWRLRLFLFVIVLCRRHNSMVNLSSLWWWQFVYEKIHCTYRMILPKNSFVNFYILGVKMQK
jgi:hypothetical protein